MPPSATTLLRTEPSKSAVAVVTVPVKVGLAVGAAPKDVNAVAAVLAPVPPFVTPSVPTTSALARSTASRGLMAKTLLVPAAKLIRLPVELSRSVPRDRVEGDVNAVSQISYSPVGAPLPSIASMTIVAVSALASSAANVE